MDSFEDLFERKSNVKHLCEVLAEGAVICPLVEKGKWEAIEKCVRALPRVSSGELEFDLVMKSIREREEQEATTLWEKGVCVPHGILPDPEPLVCVLGVSTEGVDYNSKGEKGHVMFVILGSVSVRRGYLGVLAQIARLFRSGELGEKILKLSTPGEILDLIREAERV
jgi:mannitol/fructose-specific phosphotransferase system IIA component (Ntr-type)